MSLASPRPRNAAARGLARDLRLQRRALLSAGGGLGTAALLSACGGVESSSSSGGDWSFTDDRDETAELGVRPTSVVAFTGTAAALYDFGVEVGAVFGPTVTADGEPDLMAGRMPVDDLEIIGNVFGEFDVEKFAATEPQVLVTQYKEGFGELWYVPEESVDEVEALAPVIAIASGDRPIEEVIDRHAELAEALGADLDSEAVAAGRERFDAAAEAVSEAAAANPVRVMPCSPTAEAFFVGAAGAFDLLALCVDLGVEFVDPADPDVYWEQLSWETADRYPADLILLDRRTYNPRAEDLADFPTWNALPAVAADQVMQWNPEPIYSHVGAAVELEALAEALSSAQAL